MSDIYHTNYTQLYEVSDFMDNNIIDDNLLILVTFFGQQSYTNIIKYIIFCHKYSAFPFLSSKFFLNFLNLKI